MVLGLAAAIAAAGLQAGEGVSAGYCGKLEIEGSGVTMQPRFLNLSWCSLKVSGRYVRQKDGTWRFDMKDGDKTVVEGRASFSLAAGAVKASWTFDVKRDFPGNFMGVAVSLPCGTYAGGSLVAGAKSTALPESQGKDLFSRSLKAASFEVKGAGGGGFRVDMDEARPFLVQDNRKWNLQTFSIRISVGGKDLKAGERRHIGLTLGVDGGISELSGDPITIRASDPGWVPVKDSSDVIAGSALDFSRQGWLDAPAGKHGRVVAKGPHFEFERLPGVSQRFYGVNLCSTANFPSRAEADALASRLARLGYNALRIHHHERTLTEGSADGTTINPARMAQLDDLAAACIENGIYITTDLYVSRAPTWRALGIDRDGKCDMLQYKEMCLFHEGAYRNLCEFSRQFLGHVNARTGRSWADESALAWIAFINEGNPGNRGFDNFISHPEAVERWKAWLAAKKRTDPATYRDVTEKIPHGIRQNLQCRAFSMFLADLQRDFDRRFTAFLRDELKCRALFSNLSCWNNPVEFQLVRMGYDYVDDHFYVDHPRFLEDRWRLPSQCRNVNPARGANAGFQGVVNRRLLDRPFTISEFNFSGPGRWRGVGGMMLGAQAALQDYGGVWRFAWSHRIDNILEPGHMGYFDTARDPLTRATERAAMCLFLRCDIATFERTVPTIIPPSPADDSLSRGAAGGLKNLWFGWYAKLGTLVADSAPAGSFGSFSYPSILSLTDDALKEKVAGLKPGDGHVSIDRENGVFGLSMPRTCGFSCEGGRVEMGCLAAEISLAPAAVWASSLDGAPLETSRRILVNHVTDVQNDGIRYADRDRQILLEWGGLPHLMQRGRAEISLRRKGPADGLRAYALGSNGARRGEIPLVRGQEGVSFSADTARDPSEATFMYEIVDGR